MLSLNALYLSSIALQKLISISRLLTTFHTLNPPTPANHSRSVSQLLMFKPAVYNIAHPPLGHLSLSTEFNYLIKCPLLRINFQMHFITGQQRAAENRTELIKCIIKFPPNLFLLPLISCTIASMENLESRLERFKLDPSLSHLIIINRAKAKQP